MPSQLRILLQEDLRVALRARDSARIAVLRCTLAALANAEAVDITGTVTGAVAGVGVHSTESTRLELTAERERRIVEAERAELEAAADELARHERFDRAEELRAQADVLAEVLSRAGAG